MERVHWRYEGRLLGYVARRVSDRASAEDLVQETFLGFLTSLPNFDAAQPLEGYLFSIAAHKLTDLMRREGAGRRCRWHLTTAAAAGSRPIASAAPAASPAAASATAWKRARWPLR